MGASRTESYLAAPWGQCGRSGIEQRSPRRRVGNLLWRLGQYGPRVASAAGDFKLSITKALADQLADAMRRLEPAPLTPENLQVLEGRPGVYELYVGAKRVYVGKAKANLPERLAQHQRKLSGRQNIDIQDVTFQCLYVDEDLDSASPERMLIGAYAAEGTISWNNNGFGNKDPGRRRDRTKVKAAHFDAQFPINLDARVTVTDQDTEYALDALADRVKAALPYNLRRDKQDHVADLRSSRAVLPAGEWAVTDLMRLIVGALPIGWQATALPGYLILYREHSEYESALRVWRRDPTGDVEETELAPTFGSGPVRDADITGTDDED